MAKDREHRRPQQCMNCSGTEFTEEDTRDPSKWGAASHVMRHYICEGCSFVMTFYLKKSRATA